MGLGGGGYYGLGPGMKTKDQMTPLELALRKIPMDNWVSSLDILEKVFRNVVQNGKEEKFRKLKLGNAKISATITSLEGALEALLVAGWIMSDETNEAGVTETVITLPADVKYTFPSHVNKIIEAKDHFKKEEERVRVERGMSRVAVGEFKSLFSDKREASVIAADTAKNIAAYRGAIVN